LTEELLPSMSATYCAVVMFILSSMIITPHLL
jgi:hypothetical protein